MGPRANQTEADGPELAYVPIITDGGWIVALVVENEGGYRDLEYGPYQQEDRAGAIAQKLNARSGVSSSRALMIALSSMSPLPADQHAKRRASWDVLEARAAARRKGAA